MNKTTLLTTGLVSALLSTAAFSYGGLATDASGAIVRTNYGCLHYGNPSEVDGGCPSASGTEKMPMKAVMAKPKMMKPKMAKPVVKKPVMAKTEMAAPEPIVKKIISLDGVTFKTGSNQLTGASLNTLDSVAQSLIANPDTKIIVAGHTDNTGDALKNLKLSQARAEAVREHLITQGVGAKQLVARGYGDTQAVSSNDTTTGRSKNRRVELRILK